MGKCTERLYNGIVKENPTFVQMLGMCPTLAVTSSAINGAGMGLTTTCILVLSNAVISMLRKVIPDKVRIPSYIVIIASFVTVIQFLLEAYIPSLNDSLGIYIPLIVVNCIILGRAESYASKNKVLPSIFDGIGMGLGFTIGLTLIGAFRELIGKGSIFSVQILGEGNVFENVRVLGDILGSYTPITIFVLAPGAFFVLAFIIAVINKRNAKKLAKATLEDEDVIVSCKPEACMGCANIMCSGRIKVEEVEQENTLKKDTAEEKKPDEKSEKPKIVIPEKIARKPETKEASKTDESSNEKSEGDDTLKPDEKLDEKPDTDDKLTADEAADNDDKLKTDEAADSDDKHKSDEATDINDNSDDEASNNEEAKPEEKSEAASDEDEKTINEEAVKKDVPRAVEIPIPPEKENEAETEAEAEPEEKEPHPSDITATSKLIRPDVEDASQVDKYSELESDYENKNRKRNKRRKGGRR